MEREGMARHGYLSRGPEFLVTPLTPGVRSVRWTATRHRRVSAAADGPGNPEVTNTTRHKTFVSLVSSSAVRPSTKINYRDMRINCLM